MLDRRCVLVFASHCLISSFSSNGFQKWPAKCFREAYKHGCNYTLLIVLACALPVKWLWTWSCHLAVMADMRGFDGQNHLVLWLDWVKGKCRGRSWHGGLYLQHSSILGSSRHGFFHQRLSLLLVLLTPPWQAETEQSLDSAAWPFDLIIWKLLFTVSHALGRPPVWEKACIMFKQKG